MLDRGRYVAVVRTVLLVSQMEGNMESLYRYYQSRLGSLYRDRITVKLISQQSLRTKGMLMYHVEQFRNYLRSYDCVVSDTSTRLFSRAREAVFICHGYGTKKTPGNDELADRRKLKRMDRLKSKVSTIVTLSNRDESYFLQHESLRGNPEYMPLGLPRNDCLYSMDFTLASRKWLDDEFGTQNKRVILYAPTWRGYKCQVPVTDNDIGSLDMTLRDAGHMLLYRPHYYESILPLDLLSGRSNIAVVDSHRQPSSQLLLAACDMLMTDYSSIFVDYLLLNRPIVFYPFDCVEYQNYRGLVFDLYDKCDAPGPIISSLGEITEYMQSVQDGCDLYAEYRNSAANRYHDHLDDSSCERVWNLILQKLGEATR